MKLFYFYWPTSTVEFFNNYLFFKFINKCQKEFVRCAPLSSHVCDFLIFIYFVAELSVFLFVNLFHIDKASEKKRKICDYIYIIWAFIFPKDIFYKYIDIFVHDIPGVEIFFSGVRHFFRNCSVLFLKIFHLTTTYVDAKSWFLSDHQHTFSDFEANVKLHFFIVWSKNKYNSNLCTWNYSEHFHNCKNFWDFMNTFFLLWAKTME